MKMKAVDCSDVSSEFFPRDLLIPNFESNGSAQSQELRQTIIYPNVDSVSMEVPNAWINESRDRLGVISVDRKLEIAGTLYNAENKSLEEFARTKEAAMLEKMPWYPPVSG